MPFWEFNPMTYILLSFSFLICGRMKYSSLCVNFSNWSLYSSLLVLFKTSGNFLSCMRTSNLPGDSDHKESVCNAVDTGSIWGWEDPLEKEMANNFSFLAWEIPWTEGPGDLQSTGLQRVGHNLATQQQWQCTDQYSAKTKVLLGLSAESFHSLYAAPYSPVICPKNCHPIGLRRFLIYIFLDQQDCSPCLGSHSWRCGLESAPRK